MDKAWRFNCGCLVFYGTLLGYLNLPETGNESYRKLCSSLQGLGSLWQSGSTQSGSIEYQAPTIKVSDLSGTPFTCWKYFTTFSISQFFYFYFIILKKAKILAIHLAASDMF
jgi:hypothetical protein